MEAQFKGREAELFKIAIDLSKQLWEKSKSSPDFQPTDTKDAFFKGVLATCAHFLFTENQQAKNETT